MVFAKSLVRLPGGHIDVCCAAADINNTWLGRGRM